MAGFGIRLNRIFRKNALPVKLSGAVHSTWAMAAPMLLVVLTVLLMQRVLGFSTVSYVQRELFSCTLLYSFIFALLTAAPFNAVLSRYVSDAVYREADADILPCYELGLLLNVTLSCLVGIPFCLWQHFAGGVPVRDVFSGFCGYIALVYAFYSMRYLSVCKEHRRIALFYVGGLLVAFLLSVVLCRRFGWAVTRSMLFALTVGFFVIATLEQALVRQYFTWNSNRYKPVLQYFRRYWQLVPASFLYTLGLYLHNFVFWTMADRTVVAKSFVFAQPYDLASCIAMFTNLSATVILAVQVENRFDEKYRAFSAQINGGRGRDIRQAQQRMFRTLAEGLENLVRVQSILSVVLFLACMVLLPQLGLSGSVMQSYPLLAAGYFIVFVMYDALIFLHYLSDVPGVLAVSACFCGVTGLASAVAAQLPAIWWGSGLVLGAFAGWSAAYARLRWIEKHMDAHTFCAGTLFPYGRGEKPSGRVFDRRGQDTKAE